MVENKNKMVKNVKKKTTASVCTLKRPPASRQAKYMAKNKPPTAIEMKVARAVKQLRALHPHKKQIGRVLVRTYLNFKISDGVLKRLFHTRTFEGQVKEVPHYVRLHQEHMEKIKKSVSSGVFIHLSQGDTTRTSRKASCC